MRQLKSILFLMAGCVLILSGCGGEKITKKTTIQELGDLGAPEWVVKGSGAFSKERGKVFYGVASASNIQSASLLRSTADNRARSEVAKILDFYTASLMKDYIASTSAGEANVSSEEQHTEQAIKTVTAATLSGVEIIDHWQNPATMELFSLARLDIKDFKENVEKAKELNARVKEYIRQNADKLHDELEKEEEKMIEGR